MQWSTFNKLKINKINATYFCIFVLQLYFSSLLFRFKCKNEFYFRNMYSRTFKRKMVVSWNVKLFWTTLFSPSMCSTRGCEWKIIGEMLASSFKNKSRSHFLKEIFWPEYSKSLRLRSAAFEMQLSHRVGVHLSNVTLLFALK